MDKNLVGMLLIFGQIIMNTMEIVLDFCSILQKTLDLTQNKVYHIIRFDHLQIE